MNRRQFVAGCGVAITTATAGCLDSVPVLGSDGPSADTPAGVVEIYINLQEKMFSDPESAQERLSEITHSQSPQQRQGNAGGSFSQNGDLKVTNINGINTRTRDLSTEQMRALANSEFTDQPLLDASVIETLSSQETALVDASYDTDAEFEIEGETREFQNTNKRRFLVATEDGKWRIVLQTPGGA
ncbi:hypothetical protein SAMN05216226_101240 [Halovenus aranensis]|jgi:hypothetical protein|uniref:Uncharacterized protein n=1 Tax=Halovenus aranensis TaxID=890420 RepID=A0A1G8S372_9EURY|nr:hypothetical protein [Halovenus aranensis]SDJ23225.1 hypothetical protein SAMN05216226_101240 [Halovenus aranensis]